MTKQPLPLDQFEHVRAMVSASIDARAYRASVEIGETIEHIRRSIGQRTRRAIERIAR